MGTVKIRHLVRKGAGWYWQPSRTALAAGFRAEALGRNQAEAIRRAEELNAALDAERQDDMPARKDTVAWLIGRYRADHAYTSKAPKTRRGYDQCLDLIERFCGDFRIEQVTAPGVKEWYRVLYRNPWQANAVMRVFRILMKFAMSEGKLAVNPLAGITIHGQAPRDQVWAQDEVDAFIAAALDLGMPSMALAVRLGYDTGQREGDVLVATSGQVKVGSIEVKQRKTGALVNVPLTPDAMRAIKTWGGADTMVICEATGAPYSEHLFRKKFAEVRAKAGIRASIQFRDLRRTAVVHMARGGATRETIAAVTGHTVKSIATIIETYLPRDSEMAGIGITALSAYRKRAAVGKQK